MLMSMERFRIVHKMMWDTVISRADEIKKQGASVHLLKRGALINAYNQGLISEYELYIIEHNDNCLLCAMFTCDFCVLDCCHMSRSLYRRALEGDVAAMKEIRDVVDKPPFTDLSFVDLH